jgi:hypothetical protein
MLAFHLILGNAAITVLVELLNKLTRFVCKIAAGDLSILGFHLIQGRKARSLNCAASRCAQRTTNERREMENGCWSIAALRDVNSLAASIALKKSSIE